MLNGITIIKYYIRDLLWRPVDPFETKGKVCVNKLKSCTRGQFLSSQETRQCDMFDKCCVSAGSSTAPGTSFTWTCLCPSSWEPSPSSSRTACSTLRRTATTVLCRLWVATAPLPSFCAFNSQTLRNNKRLCNNVPISRGTKKKKGQGSGINCGNKLAVHFWSTRFFKFIWRR